MRMLVSSSTTATVFARVDIVSRRRGPEKVTPTSRSDPDILVFEYRGGLAIAYRSSGAVTRTEQHRPLSSTGGAGDLRISLRSGFVHWPKGQCGRCARRLDDA